MTLDETRADCGPDRIAQIVAATRATAGLFDMETRGLLEVHGEDRARWLDGMISGDVEALVSAGSGAGCYATLLTNRGAIVADLHVGLIGDVFLLESARSAIPRIEETLERFIIADDVTLIDVSEERVVRGLEGPWAGSILSLASGESERIEPECWGEREIAGHAVLVGGFGFSGEAAFQMRMAVDACRGVEEALFAAARSLAPAGDAGLVRGCAEALEVMRVEAGIPSLEAELDDGVLPPEARLERAISTSKGCYVGQEIVARLRARGQVNHLLVGLRIESGALPEIGTKLQASGREIGEITSVARSPAEGAIALGYVRREHSEAGTRLDSASGAVRVTALPFVAPAPVRGADA